MRDVTQILHDLRLAHESVAHVLVAAQANETLDAWAAENGQSYSVGEGYVELSWADYWGKSARLFESKAEAAAAIVIGAI